MVVLSKALLYPSFAFLIGGLILTLVPTTKRPSIKIKRSAFALVVLSIIMLSFVPIFSSVSYVSNIFSLSFFQGLELVLTNFTIGKTWLVTVVIGIFLAITIILNKKDKRFVYFVALLLGIVMIFIVSKGSHMASLQPNLGYITHGMHFLSVSIWVGILFVIGLCAIDEQNWLAFLKWYTPVAITSVLTVTFSGLFLMGGTTPEYANSFMLSYGQFLLLKHLLFILIILYGVINGIIIRRKLKRDSSFRPKKWLRLESVFILLVLFITALMTESTPPHNVSVTLERTQPSSIFEKFHGSVGPYSTVVFSGSLVSYVFIIMVLVCVFFLFRTAFVNNRIFKGIISSAIFLIASYLFVMTTISVENTFMSEGVIFHSVEEAILKGHQENDQLTILQKGNRYDDIIYVLYTINESELISELLFESESGYERIWDSRLTIGGIPIIETDYKIRTFLITDGPWLQQGYSFTYVTFGFIQEPKDVDTVEIRYEGEHKKVPIKNQSFFNLSYSNDQWEALHPIIFYDQSENEVGDYMRGIMETDAYCH
ncbi:hypothetical protein BKP37_10865 [Anaerobacillus alkalilacustris]|uniref:Copper resistance protein D domain-containing protein n=1 Tax=Anaerobacillus alkalilacustris TaxID=393763 RepID=A0A1S2LKG1_9BACI|nr:CopD family protein [Anaerobacillus alkalilacustris]OIJ13019.1 hypothetical protein BKP37_10865 [Anaerobacillus alkalilacustris]